MKCLMLCTLLIVATVHCATITISTSGNSFSPSSVSAKINDTISFQNIGSIHNVVQVNGPDEVAATEGGFRSGAIGEVTSFNLIVTQDMANDGDILYFICEAHVGVGMRGSIAVSAVGSPPASTVQTTTTTTVRPTTTTTRPVGARSSSSAIQLSAVAILAALIALIL